MLRLRAWFDETIDGWEQLAKIPGWREAKPVLAKISWLQTFEGERVLEKMWRDAVLDAA